MKRAGRFLSALRIAGAGFASSGCLAVVAAGAVGAGVLYTRRELEVASDATPPDVAEATVEAFDDMSIPLVSRVATSFDARVVGTNAAGDEITVTIERAPEGGSTVQIRIGTFGDEEASQALWESIQSNL